MFTMVTVSQQIYQSLSNDNGLFPMSFGFERMALKLTAGVEGSITNKIFLHDGKNIGQLGENIEGTEYFISSAPTVIFFSSFFVKTVFPKICEIFSIVQNILVCNSCTSFAILLYQI